MKKKDPDAINRTPEEETRARIIKRQSGIGDYAINLILQGERQNATMLLECRRRRKRK